MVCKLSDLTLMFLLMLCSFASPASAISVSVSSGDSGGSIMSSESFDLDDSTYLQDGITLDGGSMYLSRQAGGAGENSLEQALSGKDYSLQNNIKSVGSFSAYTSSIASPREASLSQDVAGTGSMSLALQSTQPFAEAVQEAGVVSGDIVSTHSISAGPGVFAGQSTKMAGQSGYVGSGAFSMRNSMVATGSFQGESSLDAALSSGGWGDAVIGGKVAVNGATWLDDATLKEIGSETLGMSLHGLQETPSGIGTFDMTAANVMSWEKAESEGGEESSTLYQGGSSSSYDLTGWRWNTYDPKVQLYLKASSVPSNINQESARTAISDAANTWDDAVAQNIFADGQTVISDSSKAIDTGDGFNVHAWKYIPSSGTLAYCRTWYNYPIVDGYWSATESDVSYNTNTAGSWSWSTTGGDIDVQTVALHELGHTIGMGDLYTLPSGDPRRYDWDQIMNSYNDVQRTLGNGDLAGARVMYGTPIWDGWSDLGGYCTSNPYLIEDSLGRTHVLVRGSDNALWDKVDGVWHSLGGYCTSDPSAVMDTNGDIYVFVRGSDYALWTRRLNTADMSLTSWLSLGGYCTSDSSAVYDGNGGIYPFVRGSDNALWTKRLNTADMSLSSWLSLGGYCTSDSSAVHDGNGGIYSFVRGSDNALWTKRLNTADMSLSSWRSLGGYCTSDSSAVYDGNGGIYSFVRGSDNALWTKRLNTADMSLSSWRSLGGYCTSDSSAVYDSSIGKSIIAVVGGSKEMRLRYA